ncbi:MAG: undecaprenyldiphospho-muramoylpentapeptide beta-N-acetylglucosaminyltransferase [Burkholderiales bacterium]|nr:undecaprenyldiphospho-muramoylpentapeptide beta-N-acetylglucosaminyltransferase [Burkholderiales bacterium]
MITTGGTGGHIYPGVAVAHKLQAAGWQVFWLGTENGMEARIVPNENIEFESISFDGIRGKGLRTMIFGSFELLRALWQSMNIIKRRRPDVVIGFGGFASFPGAFAAVAKNVPLVIHEANAVPGLANRILRYGADKVLVGFRGVFREGKGHDVIWSGNPVREEMLRQPPPDDRFLKRAGTLQLLVVGGSLGAQAINKIVPAALKSLPEDKRPRVVHQVGKNHLDAVQKIYAEHQIDAVCVPFIDEMGRAYSEADIVICRGGAMTIAELTAVGVGALIVPLASAIADEQSANAEALTRIQAADKISQKDLTADVLAKWLMGMTRERALAMANAAYALRRENAAEDAMKVCMGLGSAFRRKRLSKGTLNEA